MPIFGKVVETTPHKRAAHKSRLEDVPKAIFGKVTPKQWSKHLSGLPVTLCGGVWQLLYIRAKVMHRGWAYFQARLAFTMAAFNVLVQWHGFQPTASGFVPLSIAEFSL